MHQALGVGGGEAVGDLPAQTQHLRHRQLGFALEAVFQRFTFEELHGQVGSATLLADLVDGGDVIVLDGSLGAGIAQEALLGRPAGGHSG